MRAASIALIVATACSSAAAPNPAPTASFGVDDPCAAPESSQFDFWIGDWDLTVVDPKGTNTARETVTKTGCVVSEHYLGYFQGKPDYEATSDNQWDTKLRKWRQRYVDRSGVYWYTGSFANGTMTLYASTEGGAVANTNRVLWTNITNDSLDWLWQRTLDSGTTWSVELARIHYERR